jgi:hypothetical protein
MTTAKDPTAIRQDAPTTRTRRKRIRLEPSIEGYWTKRQFAEKMGVTEHAVDRWWARRYGPRRRSFGGEGVRAAHAVYKISEVMEWLDELGQPARRRGKKVA